MLGVKSIVNEAKEVMGMAALEKANTGKATSGWSRRMLGVKMAKVEALVKEANTE